jgi:hypothetical protein
MGISKIDTAIPAVEEAPTSVYLSFCAVPRNRYFTFQYQFNTRMLQKFAVLQSSKDFVWGRSG